MKLNEQPIKAFPHTRPTEMGKWCGMDLRDYFAAKAMQAVVNVQETAISPPQNVAEIAYMFADAMMTARKCK